MRRDRSIFAAAALCAAALLTASLSARQAPSPAIPLPNKPDDLKFLVLGDNGTGDPPEYQTAQQMAAWHAKFAFPIAVMMGDNIYGDERPQDFVKKFEAPYKPLLDAGVKFYASLGNHDSREQRFYNLYNMGGKLYYSFKAPKEDVRFYMLESTYMDDAQVKWVENELKTTNEKWKIVVFHHPLYSSGKTHGSQLKLRSVLEPLFIKYNVSLVLNGHDHIYERIKLQNDIQYFVEGSSGQLRDGDIRKGTGLTAFGNDTQRTFILMEISGDDLWFNTINDQGQVIDSGTLTRRKAANP